MHLIWRVFFKLFVGVKTQKRIFSQISHVSFVVLFVQLLYCRVFHGLSSPAAVTIALGVSEKTPFFAELSFPQTGGSLKLLGAKNLESQLNQNQECHFLSPKPSTLNLRDLLSPVSGPLTPDLEALASCLKGRAFESFLGRAAV